MSNPTDASRHCPGTTPRGPPLYTYRFDPDKAMSESYQIQNLSKSRWLKSRAPRPSAQGAENKANFGSAQLGRR